MAEAKQGDGSTMDAIKAVFSSGQATDEGTTAAGTTRSASPGLSAKSAKRNSTFKIVPKRESMVLPDVGHERGWIRKQGERDEAATEGEGWKSSACVLSVATL